MDLAQWSVHNIHPYRVKLRLTLFVKAMVAGCNLICSPAEHNPTHDAHFSSPDDKRRAFDRFASGSMPGEGVSTLIVKLLADAIREGDCIRAVIRSTTTIEDESATCITQPHKMTSENFIRQTYMRAGLSLEHTRYFESNGTGMTVEDAIETQAIGSVFAPYRSTKEPMYM